MNWTARIEAELCLSVLVRPGGCGAQSNLRGIWGRGSTLRFVEHTSRHWRPRGRQRRAAEGIGAFFDKRKAFVDQPG